MSFSQLILLTVLHHILFLIYICSFFFFLSTSLFSLSSIPHTSYYPPFHTHFIILYSSHSLLFYIPHTSFYPPFHTHFITLHISHIIIILHSTHLLLSSFPHSFYYPPHFTHFIIPHSSHLPLSSILHTSYPIFFSSAFFPLLTSSSSHKFFSVAFCC